MRKAHKEYSSRISGGHYLESALLGKPREVETGLPIQEAFNQGQLVPLLKKNIAMVMQKIREGQKDDPSFPKRPFMKHLLNDIEDELARQFDLPASYEVRIHSAVGTVLDLGGVDFWVELYDEKNDKVLSDFKIDLKSNPHGRMGRMADYFYYCDEEIASEDDAEAIYEAPDYRDLVYNSSKHLSQALKETHVRSTRVDVERLQL